jgi:hypothetical protein
MSSATDYSAVPEIHNKVQFWMPGFTGMTARAAGHFSPGLTRRTVQISLRQPLERSTIL